METKILIALLAVLSTAAAWGKGMSVYDNPQFADAPNQWVKSSMYGTHDYLAQLALKFLPVEEKAWIQNQTYFYGTELPDSGGMDESIGDRNAQYVRFSANGAVTDDLLAQRAMKNYEYMINSLTSGTTVTAAKWAGVIASYISDAGLFSRVIETSENGLAFEGYAQTLTDIVYPSEEFDAEYGDYIKYDGSLEMISPYDAVMRVAQATYLGKKDGSCSAQWMEDNYNVDSPMFTSCAGRNFNNIVNAIADVLHTAYQAGVNSKEYELYAYDWANAPSTQPQEPTEKPPVNETPVTKPPAKPPATKPPATKPPSTTESKPTGQKSDSSGWLYLGAMVVVFICAFMGLWIFTRKGTKKVKKPVKKAPKPVAKGRVPKAVAKLKKAKQAKSKKSKKGKGYGKPSGGNQWAEESG